ncbi:MAG: GNAT family N-acetyltransferase [Acidimicrobiia bacterium]
MPEPSAGESRREAGPERPSERNPEPSAGESRREAGPEQPSELRPILDAAARGTFPPEDGAVQVLPPVGGRADVLVGFTGHFVLAAAVDADEVTARVPIGDFSVPMSASFLSWLSRRLGREPGTLDAVLAAPGTGEGAREWLVRDDDAGHPRVVRARRYRNDVSVYTTIDGTGILIVGRGLCGRWEMAFEVAAGARGHGLGRRLVEASRCFVPSGEYVWAQVAPGNAASLRAIVAGGFAPICAEVLFPAAR